MTEIRAMLSGRTVLLVEDEYFIAEDMAYQQKTCGAKVVGPVASVDAAIRLIEQTERIDGAIVDLNLRGVMSWPILDALLQRGVPCVLTTGYDKSSIAACYAEIVRCEKPTTMCPIPDDHIDPRRSAFFMARSVLRDIRSGVRAC